MRIHLYIYIYLICKHKYVFFFKYTRACFCISIYIINVHSTQKRLIWMRLITIHNLTALLIFNHESWFSVLLLKKLAFVTFILHFHAYDYYNAALKQY